MGHVCEYSIISHETSQLKRKVANGCCDPSQVLDKINQAVLPCPILLLFDTSDASYEYSTKQEVD